MTKKGEGWISRRGQAGAASAVELVLERQPQEQLLQIADALIEDSPYQARGPISDASVSELAQGMAGAGFQGVLIVRPHSDTVKRRQGLFQLVYGHRRRAAWRLVCQRRGEQCVLPVVVREVSDAQMLTIGAQENLQRQDLDPVEEAQIVAWAERMFFDKNQAEIGEMLGKSSDWVSTRSRIHKLPEAIKAVLQARPRATGQALELGALAQRDPTRATILAERVITENMALDVLRSILRADALAESSKAPREGTHNRRDVATSVQSVTNTQQAAPSDSVTQPRGSHYAPQQTEDSDRNDSPSGCGEQAVTDAPIDALILAALLQEAAAALAVIAGNAHRLPRDPIARRALAHIRQHITIIEQVMTDAPAV